MKKIIKFLEDGNVYSSISNFVIAVYSETGRQVKILESRDQLLQYLEGLGKVGHRYTSEPLSIRGIASRLKRGDYFFTKDNLHKIIEDKGEAYYKLGKYTVVSKKPESNKFDKYVDQQVNLGSLGNNHITKNGHKNWPKLEVKTEIKAEYKGDKKMSKVVKVRIMDKDKKVAIENVVVMQTEEFAVRANTDLEAVLELVARGVFNPAKVLDKHNKVRAKTLDEERSLAFGRDVFLPKIEWKDLAVAVEWV